MGPIESYQTRRLSSAFRLTTLRVHSEEAGAKSDAIEARASTQCANNQPLSVPQSQVSQPPYALAAV